MWLFTKDHFFSAVCARKGDGRHGQPPDPNRMMVRTRIRGHLEALKHRFPALLGECNVKEFAGTDYAYRIFVDKDVWREVVAASVDAVDYDNFKSEVAGIRAAQERPTRGRCTRFGK